MKKSELRELIREQVRNLIKEASVSQEAYTIHNITKCGQDAAQNFIDDNKLDGKKLAAYVRQHSNSKEKYDVRDIIAGTGVGANVGFKSRFLKQFKESVLKEALIGPFAISNSTPDDELIAMYHGALDGFSNYKTGMKFKKSEYKLAYQTIEKILQKKGVAITEASITEAKEYSFTFDYNTEPDDIEYIENLLKKARVNAYAEQGTFDDEMVIKAGDAIELRKAKKAIEADGFEINEADDPEAGEAAPYGSGYSEVNEDAGMVIDVAMGVAVGLMGLWAMVQSAPLVGRVFGDAAEYLANKSEKKAKLALKNQRKETIAPIIAKFKNDTQLADMYQALTPYDAAAKLGSSQAGLKAQQGRVNQLTKIGKYIKSKLTPEEMAYFRDISAMLRDGDIKESIVNEAIDIHNDESAMKALEDIAVNMTKWKGSEGAHYTDLLEKVIDFLKYGNHRTN
jgi:hypothetical protein